LQTSFFGQPRFVANEVKLPKKQITDEIVAISAEQSFKEIKVRQALVDLSDLPIERNWPIKGKITTYFSSHHPAIDIANSWGTPIHPFASGFVVEAKTSGSWGKYIIIRHNDGYETAYAHLSAILVSPGQSITTSTVIGKVGSTGNSTGPHLHFQVIKNNQLVNPLSTLP